MELTDFKEDFYLLSVLIRGLGPVKTAHKNRQFHKTTTVPPLRTPKMKKLGDGVMGDRMTGSGLKSHGLAV